MNEQTNEDEDQDECQEFLFDSLANLWEVFPDALI
jgi:hypothetical protein